MDFNEWRAQFPDGTRILWQDISTKEWLPGSIIGTRLRKEETVLLFRLDSDPRRKGALPHMLSLKYRELIKKQ